MTEIQTGPHMQTAYEQEKAAAKTFLTRIPVSVILIVREPRKLQKRFERKKSIFLMLFGLIVGKAINGSGR